MFEKEYKEKKELDLPKTLEEFFNLMLNYGDDYKKISLKTAKHIFEIMNGSKDSYMVFDNAGGMAFDVWKMDKENINAWLNSKDSLRDDLIFGYVIEGKTQLHEYQLKYPSWLICEAVERKEKQK